MLTAPLFVATLAQAPNSGSPLSFEPNASEVTVDEQGLEILAFDEDGAMIGALVMTPDGDRVQVDASFADGYVSVGLLILGPDDMAGLRELPPDLDTDFSPAIAATRIEAMLALLPSFDREVATPGASPLEYASRRECMWLFAGAALTCGVSVLTPGNMAVAAGCLVMVHNGICKCEPYIPIKIC